MSKYHFAGLPLLALAFIKTFYYCTPVSYKLELLANDQFISQTDYDLMMYFCSLFWLLKQTY